MVTDGESGKPNMYADPSTVMGHFAGKTSSNIYNFVEVNQINPNVNRVEKSILTSKVLTKYHSTKICHEQSQLHCLLIIRTENCQVVRT